MAERNNDDAWGRSTIQTAWPLDYPDSCSLSVSVERGVLVTLDGSTREPVTEGYICGKVRRFGDRIYGPDRLHRAGVRVGVPREEDSLGTWVGVKHLTKSRSA